MMSYSVLLSESSSRIFILISKKPEGVAVFGSDVEHSVKNYTQGVPNLLISTNYLIRLFCLVFASSSEKNLITYGTDCLTGNLALSSDVASN